MNGEAMPGIYVIGIDDRGEEVEVRYIYDWYRWEGKEG